MKTPRTTYCVTLEATPGDDRPAACRLKLLLKTCLRAWGLKCIGLAELKTDQPAKRIEVTP